MFNRKKNNELVIDARERRGSSQAGLVAVLLAELLIGSLAGAVAMLLLAPRSGKRS